MNTLVSPALAAPLDTQTALRFITCGSVDDGKSTLIGRLLVDTKAVLQDHLAGVQRQGETDLALLTDGLSAEREQGITIDVAYRYFSTERRKFIIGDAPGHEQYTRNMVTAASSADAAVVLVDAIKLDWRQPDLQLLPQTRRHALLAQLLRVPSIVFAINKLDAVDDATLAYQHIAAALRGFAAQAGIAVQAVVPVSALKGWNVVQAQTGWCGYSGPSLLDLLHDLPVTPPDVQAPFGLPVQWVEKFHDSGVTTQGRRVFWGRVAAGLAEVGQAVRVLPSGHRAVVAQVVNHVRQEGSVRAGRSAGVVLDREVDVSRGDWLVADANSPSDSEWGDSLSTDHANGLRELQGTLAWLDDEPLLPGRVYWALHGHRWVKAKIKAIDHQLDIHTLQATPASQLAANTIARVTVSLQEPVAARPYAEVRTQGALVLVDTASNRTAGALMVA
jgi:sulfate adenylyltransferase subunit 1